jgi:hypothetical protein
MRRLWIALATALAVVATAAAGFAVGSASAPSSEEAAHAREAARSDALRSAEAEAHAAARSDGLERGKRRGERDGEREGADAGGTAGGSAADGELAETTTAEAATSDEEAERPVICDGAIADDAHYAACLEQAGEPIPSGFPGGPSGECPTEPPFPVDGRCADVRP